MGETGDAGRGRAHGLSEEDDRRLAEALAREPTDEELGVAAVLWSEHCSYKSSRAALQRLPTTGPGVLQGPGENAGAVAVGDGLAVVFKIESHNHPSYLAPYQGAATGVGGILRDVFAMGARPIATLNSLRFGSPAHSRTSHLLRGVIAGIGGYGNAVGVPTIGGEVVFDPSYDRNCLVNVFTLGVVEESRLMRARARGAGNLIVLYGARTGRDGIHGASHLASAALDAASESKRPSVQIGDPFLEKLLLEATLEILASDLAVAIQDLGAAGLAGASVEMAFRGELGIELDLSAVPLREPSMSAYEILLSESQERMLAVVKPDDLARVEAICARWDLPCAVLGRLTVDRRIRATQGEREVVSLPVVLLADYPPRVAPVDEPSSEDTATELHVDELRDVADYGEALRLLVTSPNLCSRRWIYEQFDHYVGGNTMLRPGADAAVIRLPGSEIQVAMTVDGNARFSAIDPYLGACIAVCEAARNLVAVGARPIAVSDCLNFGSPERAEVLWQLGQTVDGIRDACLGFGIPVVSGNVSFYNESDGVSIPPTPTIAMVGIVETPEPLTPWFKADGDLIFLLGRSREELGGSEYLALVHGEQRGTLPFVDFEAERRLHQVVLTAARRGLISSAHDVSEGGLALALVEACCAVPRGREPFGARVRMEESMRADAWLFGESLARMLVSVPREHGAGLREIATEAGVAITAIGEVGSGVLDFEDVVTLSVHEVSSLWGEALARLAAAG